MTVREGAVLSAYTGVLLCESFTPVHEYIEHILERKVFPFELTILTDEIKEKSRADFEAIIRQQT